MTNADVSVVMAYRDLGDAHRRASYNYVHDWYTHLGWEIVVEPGTSRFSRAAAINAGVRKAAGRLIVQSDPDCLVHVDQLRQGIALAGSADGLVVPYNLCLRLAPAATTAVLAGRSLDSVTPADCEEHSLFGVGGVVVFSRSTWVRSGGFDERFGVWGGDDSAFAYAADAFCGPMRRLAGTMVHLWHPRLPQSAPGSRGYIEQFAILAEYRDAETEGPAAVRQLVNSLRKETPA